ncbi:hypothetical protein LTR09_001515 [Extremus antarcticus]|uniref:Uncharacterized protein n=1 Tax=Extremus antarcticus TaxID=702011 RepID=A0AAJ0LW25_9PEZI|nr:hypothetical protein LTR09_001515 [Extremus antarcticus]
MAQVAEPRLPLPLWARCEPETVIKAGGLFASHPTDYQKQPLANCKTVLEEAQKDYEETGDGVDDEESVEDAPGDDEVVVWEASADGSGEVGSEGAARKAKKAE